MQICSVINSIINFIRGLSPLLIICLIAGLLIIGFLLLRKTIKVNYNPKELKKINLAWMLLTVLVFALAIFITIVYC